MTATAVLVISARGPATTAGRFAATTSSGAYWPASPTSWYLPKPWRSRVRAYAEETNRQNHERRAQVEADRHSLEKINRGIKGIPDAIEDGMYQPAMKARMSELEQQKAEIEKRLEDAPADLPDVHPNIAEHYRAKVVRLAETLAEPEANVETREGIRSLIGEVVMTPGEKRGARATPSYAAS